MRYKHDKTEIREKEVLQELINAGVKGKTPEELYRNGDGVFGKNRNYLFDTLEKLKSKGLIWCDKISHKVRKYKVTLKDKEVLDLLAKSSKEMNKAFESNLLVIKELSGKKNAVSFYEFVLFAELANFLDALETWVRVEDKWKDIARAAVLKYNVEYFADFISECGRANPKAMNMAMKRVFACLYDKRDKSKDASGIPDRDIAL